MGKGLKRFNPFISKTIDQKNDSDKKSAFSGSSSPIVQNDPFWKETISHQSEMERIFEKAENKNNL